MEEAWEVVLYVSLSIRSYDNKKSRKEEKQELALEINKIASLDLL